jgi:membrane-associated phospholipid phosphatase
MSQVFYCATASALIETAIIALCIRWVDYPAASVFLHTSKQGGLLDKIFSGHVIVFGEIVLIAVLVLVRLKTGHLPELAKVTFIACNASIVAYAFNDLVLKLAFGRQSPSNFYQMHIEGIFHLFQGTESSSFPSGHMMLVAPFLGVFYRVYPRLRAASVSLIILILSGSPATMQGATATVIQ